MKQVSLPGRDRPRLRLSGSVSCAFLTLSIANSPPSLDGAQSWRVSWTVRSPGAPPRVRMTNPSCSHDAFFETRRPCSFATCGTRPRSRLSCGERMPAVRTDGTGRVPLDANVSARPRRPTRSCKFEEQENDLDGCKDTGRVTRVCAGIAPHKRTQCRPHPFTFRLSRRVPVPYRNRRG